MTCWKLPTKWPVIESRLRFIPRARLLEVRQLTRCGRKSMPRFSLSIRTQRHSKFRKRSITCRKKRFESAFLTERHAAMAAAFMICERCLERLVYFHDRMVLHFSNEERPRRWHLPRSLRPKKPR